MAFELEGRPFPDGEGMLAKAGWSPARVVEASGFVGLIREAGYETHGRALELIHNLDGVCPSSGERTVFDYRRAIWFGMPSTQLVDYFQWSSNRPSPFRSITRILGWNAGRAVSPSKPSDAKFMEEWLGESCCLIGVALDFDGSHPGAQARIYSLGDGRMVLVQMDWFLMATYRSVVALVERWNFGGVEQDFENIDLPHVGELIAKHKMFC